MAHSLATAASKPSILLVEVGGLADDEQHRPAFQRFLNAFMRPDLDQGYTTIPQVGVDGKELPYTRGKGLGGSSLSNFMVWTRGSSADFDRWAELVGSDDWAWKNVAQAFKKASVPSVTEEQNTDIFRLSAFQPRYRKTWRGGLNRISTAMGRMGKFSSLPQSAHSIANISSAISPFLCLQSGRRRWNLHLKPCKSLA